jgi:hypothetical protein
MCALAPTVAQLLAAGVIRHSSGITPPASHRSGLRAGRTGVGDPQLDDRERALISAHIARYDELVAAIDEEILNPLQDIFPKLKQQSDKKLLFDVIESVKDVRHDAHLISVQLSRLLNNNSDATGRLFDLLGGSLQKVKSINFRLLPGGAASNGLPADRTAICSLTTSRRQTNPNSASRFETCCG